MTESSSEINTSAHYKQLADYNFKIKKYPGAFALYRLALIDSGEEQSRELLQEIENQLAQLKPTSEVFQQYFEPFRASVQDAELSQNSKINQQHILEAARLAIQLKDIDGAIKLYRTVTWQALKPATGKAHELCKKEREKAYRLFLSHGKPELAFNLAKEMTSNSGTCYFIDYLFYAKAAFEMAFSDRPILGGRKFYLEIVEKHHYLQIAEQQYKTLIVQTKKQLSYPHPLPDLASILAESEAALAFIQPTLQATKKTMQEIAAEQSLSAAEVRFSSSSWFSTTKKDIPVSQKSAKTAEGKMEQKATKGVNTTSLGYTQHIPTPEFPNTNRVFTVADFWKNHLNKKQEEQRQAKAQQPSYGH